MDTQTMVKPALIAGIAAGLASAIPPISWLNCFCCALVIGGGVLASYLYIKDSPFAISAGQGALVGLLAGLISATTSTIVHIPISLIAGATGAIALREVLSRPDIPPEARRWIELFSRPGFSLIALFFSFIANIFIHGLFAMLGGALGVAFFEKRRGGGGPYPPQEPPYSPPPYTPPPYTPPSGGTPPSSTPPGSAAPPSEPGPPPPG